MELAPARPVSGRRVDGAAPSETRRTLDLDLVSQDFLRSLASFRIVTARADDAAVTGVMGHAKIETTRRVYAGDWREAEERNAMLLRQPAEAGIGQ